MPLLLLLLTLQAPQGERPPELQRAEREIAAVAEKCGKSVVAVTVERQGQETRKLSGFIYSPDGAIVTDASALEKAAAVKVKLHDGRELAARIAGADAMTGVAVLRIDAEKLVPVEIADPAEPRQGSYAIVIGNPQGLRASVEVGFVSGLDRTIHVSGRKYEGMVQMSTGVTAGDCGAPVANGGGKLIGIVHSAWRGDPDADFHQMLKILDRRFPDPIPGAPAALSFATPGSMVKVVADRILKHGKMVRGRMGLSVRRLAEPARAQLKIPAGEGCEVVEVDPKGPGAGVFERGDVLLSVDGRAVKDLSELRLWVWQQDERAVKAEVLRGGKRMEVEARIGVESQ